MIKQTSVNLKNTCHLTEDYETAIVLIMGARRTKKSKGEGATFFL